MRGALGCGLIVFSFCASLLAQQGRVSARIEDGRRRVLPGAAHPRALPENDEGAIEQYVVDQNLAPVVSASFGVGCEQTQSPGTIAAFQQLAQQASAQGITWAQDERRRTRQMLQRLPVYVPTPSRPPPRAAYPQQLVQAWKELDRRRKLAKLT
jgi:hypothetical protein